MLFLLTDAMSSRMLSCHKGRQASKEFSNTPSPFIFSFHNFTKQSLVVLKIRHVDSDTIRGFV